MPFVAPWTAFKNKYRLWQWPWLEIFHLRSQLAREQFAYGLSARWDPRDHLLLKLADVRDRIGFPRVGSQIFLTRPLARPDPEAHRYESWRAVAGALDIELPPRGEIPIPAIPGRKTVLIHSGAGQPVRVWPLENYRRIAARLRGKKIPVQVVCDPDQRDWWLRAGENSVAAPATVTELIALTDSAGAFIGNDSGPGHLAAFCGVPTFTLFGPQLPEWFAPLHPTGGMDGGPGLSLHAVFGLLPLSRAALFMGRQRGGCLGARGSIRRQAHQRGVTRAYKIFIPTANGRQ